MRTSIRLVLALSLTVNLLLVALWFWPQTFTGAQAGSQYFPQTRHYIKGRFLQYWQEHGGLAQQGYPLTEEFQEVNKLNGKTYTVQYFERAIFEKHPENQPPYDVLLSQLGKFELDARYPNNSNPAAAPQAPPGGGQPTATVAPVPSGRVDLVQSGNYRNLLGGLTFLGTAKNNTGKVLQGLDVVLTLLGPNNETLGTGEGTEYSSSYIPAGALLPFLVDVEHPPASWANVRWQFVTRVFEPTSYIGQRVYKDLTIESQTLKPPANQYDDWSLVGTVKNTGTGTATFVAVHAAVYDAGGKLIDANYGYATLNDIPPGGTSPFEMAFRHAADAGLTPVKQDTFIEGDRK